MRNKYAVLMIDLKSSKKMSEKERHNCQERFFIVVDIVNSIYSNLKVKVTFSGGDGVQGLFQSIKDALDCYYLMKGLLKPYEVRCAIGYGTINEHIDDSMKVRAVNSNVYDGNAYHYAKEGLDICKNNKDYDIIINAKNDRDIIINQMLSNAKKFEDSQKSKQKIIFDIFNKLFPIDNDILLDHRYITLAHGILLENDICDSRLLNEHFNYYVQIMNYLNRKKLHKKEESKLILEDDPFQPKINDYVSTLLNVSRQTIVEHKQKGKFSEIRKMQIAALKLAKIYEEEYQ